MATLSRNTLLLLCLHPLLTSAIKHEPQRRQVSGREETIDPKSMPECALEYCTTYGGDEYDYGYDYSSYYPPECDMVGEQWPKSCFCSLKVPLLCAWYCYWDGWFDAEDWYVSEDVCGPDADDLPYEVLPSCIADCLPQVLFNQGCITEGRNCFCSVGSLGGCQDNCVTDAERSAIKTWLVEQCDITELQAQLAVDNGYFNAFSNSAYISYSLTISGSLALETSTATATAASTSTVSAKPNSKQDEVYGSGNGSSKLHWYEILAISILCFTGAAVVMIWIFTCAVRRRAFESEKAAGPDAAESDAVEKQSIQPKS